jgi:hypothetical protein
VSPFGIGKREGKPPRKDPGNREKEAGAREYEAKRQDRIADRLDGEGDAAGADVARGTAEELRKPKRRGR